MKYDPPKRPKSWIDYTIEGAVVLFPLVIIVWLATMHFYNFMIAMGIGIAFSCASYVVGRCLNALEKR